MKPEKRHREERNKKLRAMFPEAAADLLSLSELIFKMQIRRDERGRKALSRESLDTVGYTADRVKDVIDALESAAELLIALREELETWLVEKEFNAETVAIVKK